VPALDVLVRAQIACGRLDEAASAVEALTAVADAVATPALRARANLSAGMLAAATGDGTRAKSFLEDAVDGFDRCRARFDAARARIELAQALRALGRAADARREAQAAHDCLRALGAVADMERARRVAQRCDSSSGQPMPISRRERDVLRLLSEGLTNREISERLCISEHTVHRHVTNILRKLDVPSRAAAAASAVRGGLVDGPPRE
jgi:DNA-binding CsgD family transcriptional regulator